MSSGLLNFLAGLMKGVEPLRQGLEQDRQNNLAQAARKAEMDAAKAERKAELDAQRAREDQQDQIRTTREALGLRYKDLKDELASMAPDDPRREGFAAYSRKLLATVARKADGSWLEQATSLLEAPVTGSIPGATGIAQAGSEPAFDLPGFTSATAVSASPAGSAPGSFGITTQGLVPGLAPAPTGLVTPVGQAAAAGLAYDPGTGQDIETIDGAVLQEGLPKYDPSEARRLADLELRAKERLEDKTERADERDEARDERLAAQKRQDDNSLNGTAGSLAMQFPEAQYPGATAAIQKFVANARENGYRYDFSLLEPLTRQVPVTTDGMSALAGILVTRSQPVREALADLSPEERAAVQPYLEQVDKLVGLAQTDPRAAKTAYEALAAGKLVVRSADGSAREATLDTLLASARTSRETKGANTALLNGYRSRAERIVDDANATPEARTAAEAILAMRPGELPTSDQVKALRPKTDAGWAEHAPFATADLQTAQKIVADLTAAGTSADPKALTAAQALVAGIRSAQGLAAGGDRAGAVKAYQGALAGSGGFTLETLAGVAARTGQAANLKFQTTLQDVSRWRAIEADTSGRYSQPQKEQAGRVADALASEREPALADLAGMEPLLYTPSYVQQAFDQGNYKGARAGLAYLQKNNPAAYEGLKGLEEDIGAGADLEALTVTDAKLGQVDEWVQGGNVRRLQGGERLILSDPAYGATPEERKAFYETALKEAGEVKKKAGAREEQQQKLLDLQEGRLQFQADTDGLNLLNALVETGDLQTLSRLKNDPEFAKRARVTITQVDGAVKRVQAGKKDSVIARAAQFAAAGGEAGLAGLEALVPDARAAGVNLNSWRDLARTSGAGAILESAAALADAGDAGRATLYSRQFQARAKALGVNLTPYLAIANAGKVEREKAAGNQEYATAIAVRDSYLGDAEDGTRSIAELQKDPKFIPTAKALGLTPAQLADLVKRRADVGRAARDQAKLIADLEIKGKQESILNSKAGRSNDAARLRQDAERLALERKRLAQSIASDNANAARERERIGLERKRLEQADPVTGAKARASMVSTLQKANTSDAAQIRTLTGNVTTLFGGKTLTDILADDTVKGDVRTLAQQYQQQIQAVQARVDERNLNIDSLFGFPPGTTGGTAGTGGTVAPPTGGGAVPTAAPTGPAAPAAPRAPAAPGPAAPARPAAPAPAGPPAPIRNPNGFTIGSVNVTPAQATALNDDVAALARIQNRGDDTAYQQATRNIVDDWAKKLGTDQAGAAAVLRAASLGQLK